MNELNPTALGSHLGTTPSVTPSKTREAAADFEALLIAQMLRSARSSSSLTSLDGESSGSDDAITDLAEQQLSSTLASAGGLGLATLIAQGLADPAPDPQLAVQPKTSVLGPHNQ
jgi:Rod binding domain-containing protein